MMTLMRYV